MPLVEIISQHRQTDHNTVINTKQIEYFIINTLLDITSSEHI